MVKCGEVSWVNLDPTFGTEIKKTRPALIVSLDMVFTNRPSRLLLDQIRSVDKRHLLEKMGEIDKKFWHSILLEMLD